MIDIWDFAVGLSRQLHGLTMHSERQGTGCMNSTIRWGQLPSFRHLTSRGRMELEQYAGLGLRRCLYLETSEKAPLRGIACQKDRTKGFQKNNVPEGVCCLATGGREVGEWMSSDKRIPLVSANR